MRVSTNPTSAAVAAQPAVMAIDKIGLKLRLHELVDAEVMSVRSNMATLRIADQFVQVALKAELSAGQRLKLLVRDLGPNRVTLQILHPTGEGAGRSLVDADVDQYLSNLGVPATRDAREVARTLISEGLPLTRDNLLGILQALNPEGLQDSQARAAAAYLRANGLPITPETLTLALVPEENLFSAGPLVQGLTQAVLRWLSATPEETGLSPAAPENGTLGNLMGYLAQMVADFRGVGQQLAGLDSTLPGVDFEEETVPAPLTSAGEPLNPNDLPRVLGALLREWSGEVDQLAQAILRFGIGDAEGTPGSQGAAQNAPEQLVETLRQIAGGVLKLGLDLGNWTGGSLPVLYHLGAGQLESFLRQLMDPLRKSSGVLRSLASDLSAAGEEGEKPIRTAQALATIGMSLQSLAEELELAMIGIGAPAIPDTEDNPPARRQDPSAVFVKLLLALKRLEPGSGDAESPDLVHRFATELGVPLEAQLLKRGLDDGLKERSIAFLLTQLVHSGDVPEEARALYEALTAIHLRNAGTPPPGQPHLLLLPIPLANGKAGMLKVETWPEKNQQKSAPPLLRLHLHLDLDHLGEMAVVLSLVGQHLIGRIQTSDDRIRDFMASGIRTLKETLSSCGYQVGRIDCTTGMMNDEIQARPVLKTLDIEV